MILRKYNATTDTYATIEDAVISVVSLNGTTATKATYQVTDGGDLDADGEANGVIVDPAGLADGDPSSASSTSGALADTG
ncbi:hypothetical protein KDA11_01735, partial [Candidatus Saccharibacteria bacterium]|nr:hypothetical protein [Candidatus Saccharibacteria bacterium]